MLSYWSMRKLQTIENWPGQSYEWSECHTGFPSDSCQPWWKFKRRTPKAWQKSKYQSIYCEDHFSARKQRQYESSVNRNDSSAYERIQHYFIPTDSFILSTHVCVGTMKKQCCWQLLYKKAWSNTIGIAEMFFVYPLAYPQSGYLGVKPKDRTAISWNFFWKAPI